LAASLALLLGGCGDDKGAEIPANAVSEVIDIAGSRADEPILLTAADVERLATLANVEPDVLESVSASLADQEVWERSMDGVRAIYDDTPEGVESTLVEVARRAIAGTIHTAYQLH
jgi:hypothetical protein